MWESRLNSRFSGTTLEAWNWPWSWHVHSLERSKWNREASAPNSTATPMPSHVVDTYSSILVFPTFISCLIRHFVIDFWKKHSLKPLLNLCLSTQEVIKIWGIWFQNSVWARVLTSYDVGSLSKESKLTVQRSLSAEALASLWASGYVYHDSWCHFFPITHIVEQP